MGSSDLTAAEGYVAPTARLCSDLKSTRPGFDFEVTYECCKCRLLWKESEFAVYQGKRYGKPCGCDRDIPSLMARGR
jgi:hypothetical protein